MLVGVTPKIVSVFFEPLDKCSKCGIAVKVPGEKKGRFNVFFFKGGCNRVCSIAKLISGKNNGDRFVSGITSNNAAVIENEFFLTVIAG